jgi:hypothetical protein
MKSLLRQALLVGEKAGMKIRLPQGAPSQITSNGIAAA